ncbi:Predicted integral membrane protein [Nakamurella panacisegetis]|uniref:Predicted integral membrane protein n=1 Tax=Nakamurella panacisegetis TaxID=1090615 RepID=A0A1H0QVE1_9ACTN|nr:DUF2269 family protein [Nakamurella panacisegetis]SDP21105.1 Predicted integral membrane protein [Nakamurella panacisegetis]
MNTLLVTLHVVAAVFIVGPMAILPQTAMKAIRAGEGAIVERVARSTMIFSLLSLLVAVLGFGALATADKSNDWSISTPWVLIALLVYVVAVALSLLAVVPALRSAGEHLLDPAGENLRSKDYTRIAMASGIVSLLLVVVVVLMVWKP